MMIPELVSTSEKVALMMEEELPGDAIPILSVKVRHGNLNRSYH